MVVTREAPSVDTILPSTGNLSEYNDEGLACDRSLYVFALRVFVRASKLIAFERPCEEASFFNCAAR